MYGGWTLLTISDHAAKAAAIYPRIIAILNQAGVPPDDRAAVMACVLQVIGMDGGDPPVLN